MTGPPRPTSWDTDSFLWPRTSPLRLPLSPFRRRALPRARCLARIPPFEFAAADLYNPASPPPPIRALAAEVLTRRAAVDRPFFIVPRPTRPLRPWMLATAALILTATVVWLPSGVLLALAILAVAPLIITLPLRFRARTRRLHLARCLRDRACPDCGYNLAGAPEGLPGSLAGPRACPECGAAWPLVPPPA